MSNFQWFYADTQQQQQGPVTFEQIQQLAASGQILPTTLIWNESMPSWTAASQVNGVFNVGAPAVPPPVAAAPANPYTTPATGYPMANAAPTGGHYPIPPVKKCSFALFLIVSVVGLVLLVGGAFMLVADIAEVSNIESTQYQQLETREDVQRFSEENQITLEQATPPLRGFFILLAGGVIILISFGIHTAHVCRAWTILQPGGARTTPGKGGGFLWIPFFSLYWMFVAYHGWSQDWNRIKRNHSNLAHLPSVSEGLFLAMPICAIASIVPAVGSIASIAAMILLLIIAAKMCKIVNGMADASSQPR